MQGVYTAAGSMKAMHWTVPTVNPPRSHRGGTGVGLTALRASARATPEFGSLGKAPAEILDRSYFERTTVPDGGFFSPSVTSQ
jgi:hypothetical protein